MLEFLRQAFHFTKNEIRALLLLVVILLLTILFPYLFTFFEKPDLYTASFQQAEIDSFNLAYDLLVVEAHKNRSKFYEEDSSFPYHSSYKEVDFKKEKKASELFYFDPNTATAEDWERLGLSSKQAQVILNYVSKGGKFRKAEDIRKIFVIKEELKEKLIPYVQIDENKLETVRKFDYEKREPSDVEKVERKYEVKKREPIIVDVNTADSAQFERLRGIGPVLAGRIVRFRTELGGFHSVKQLRDVFGLRDSTFISLKDNLTITKMELKKININTADYQTIRSIPYLRGQFPKFILQYRKNNGSFKEVEQLKRVPQMTDSVYRRVAPYITID